MDNHVHLLLKSGPDGLSSFMRKLLTSYAISYNKRHNRHGYLFQSRYKSIICQEELYFLKLVSYIHLNPLRAGIVKTLEQLDYFPWSGHAAIMGHNRNQWQKCEQVLSFFGNDDVTARLAYRNYLEDQSQYGKQPELTGGGVKRSENSWSAITSRQPHHHASPQKRMILGSDEFTINVIAQGQEHLRSTVDRENKLKQAETDVRQMCLEKELSFSRLQSGERGRPYSDLRKNAAGYLTGTLGLSLADSARILGVSTPAVFKMLKLGESKSKKS